MENMNERKIKQFRFFRKNVMIKMLTISLAYLVLSGYATTNKKKETHGEQGSFEQDRFVISSWVDPPADEYMETRYKEMADAHFNLVLGGFGANTEANVSRQLDLCEKYGMKAIVSLPGYVKGAMEGVKAEADVKQHESFPDHKACWGYSLRDEPSAEHFSNLSYMVDYLRDNRPGKLAYVNLFPNYASPEQLGTESYKEHVFRFVNEVKPMVLCMDHYPYMEPNVSAMNLDHTSDWVLDKENPRIDLVSRAGYCENLAVLREAALEKGIPFWNFFNVMPFGDHSDPSEAQIRWQIYTSIAYGAKGILYFCYQSPIGAGKVFEKGGAILTVDGKKTRHYEEAKRVNFAIKNLGNTLMNLESTAVHRIYRNDDPNVVLKGTGIKSLSEGDYLVGEFLHSDGRRAILLNNYSFAFTSWSTVDFDADPDSVIEVDQETGLERAFIDDSPDMDGLQVSINSGAGRLFILPKE